MTADPQPQRKGDFVITASGTHFWPLDAHPDEIKIEDIAHALAQVTRWTGNAPIRHSVALHCIHVSYRAEALAAATADAVNVSVLLNTATQRVFGLTGLLHDASEAYLSDIAKPIKPLLDNYYSIEAGLQRAIGEKFAVQLEPLPQIVMQADLDLLVTEASIFFPDELWWRPGTANVHQKGGTVLTDARTLYDLRRGVPPNKQREIEWRAVRDAFLMRFEELTK